MKFHLNLYKGKMKVVVIVRDETGKYVWESELNYKPKPFTQPRDDEKVIDTAKTRELAETDEGNVQLFDSTLLYKD